MLEVESISVQAGPFMVRDVSLHIPAAACHVILGATGSGKTVFLESLIGLRQPVKGVIRINGVDVTHAPVEQRGVGYVPQDLALFPHMTARENILYAQRVRKRVRRDGSLLSSLVESLGIHHILERGVAHLSGGERQRVALARAIFSGSRVLILDEPLSSLHEGLRRELWFVLRDLAQTYRLALLVVTHDLEEAFFLGDEITILLGGKVCQQAPPVELLAHPHTREVAVFLGIRNLFPMDRFSAETDGLLAQCDALGGNLRVPRDAIRALPPELNAHPDKWLAGIHSRDVVVFGTKAPPHEFNVFSGAVTAIYHGRNMIQVMVQAGRRVPVECSLPRHDIGLLDGGVGSIVYFGLPQEKLFLVRDR
jgi:ABC-type Fe3+/spermidine/putrescine transport system ATPase subunit